MRKFLAPALTLAILSSGQAFAEGKKADAGDKSKQSNNKAEAKPKVKIPEQKMPTGFKDALVFQSMNIYDKAIPLYEMAIKSDPDFISSYNNLAQCLLKRGEKGDKEKAEAYLAKSLKMDPNNIGCLYTRAVIAEDDKKFDDAEECYRKILKSQPLNFQAVQNLSEMLFRTGKRKEAREVLTTVLQQDPPDEQKKIYEQALKNLDLKIKERSKKKTG